MQKIEVDEVIHTAEQHLLPCTDHIKRMKTL